MSLQDRVVGMYVGGILGDALGVPIEHLPRAEIRRRYGDAEGCLRTFQTRPARLSDESILLLHSAAHFTRPEGSYEESLGRLAERGEQTLQNQGFSKKMRSLFEHYRRSPESPNPHRDNPGSGFVPLVMPLVQKAITREELSRLLKEYIPKTHLLADQTWTGHYFNALYGNLHGDPIITSLGNPTVETIARNPRLATALSGNIEQIKEVEGNSESILSAALALYTASNRNFETMLKLATGFDKADYDTLFFATGALIGAAVGYSRLPQHLLAPIQTQISAILNETPAESHNDGHLAQRLKDLARNNRFLMSQRGKEMLFELVPELELQAGYDSSQPRHCYPLLEHTLRTVQAIPEDDQLLRIAGLLHDVAKPLVRKQNNGHATYHGHAKTGGRMAYEIMARLGFTKEEAEIVSHLVSEHVINYSDKWTDKAVRRFAKRNANVLERLLALVDADNSAQLPSGSSQNLKRRIKYLEGLGKDGMAYVRKPDEIVGDEFARARSEGEITLDTYLMPQEFEVLRGRLGFNYGFTNRLQPNSCLILSESDDITAMLKDTQIPTLFLDSRLTPEAVKDLSGKGTVLRGASHDHYQEVAEAVARHTGAAILYVNSFEWCNEELQRTLIAKGKHFEIGLPDVKITDPAPMHYDPDKNK
jgi:putative nucleotidyltransferase with HDIG domain